MGWWFMDLEFAKENHFGRKHLKKTPKFDYLKWGMECGGALQEFLKIWHKKAHKISVKKYDNEFDAYLIFAQNGTDWSKKIAKILISESLG